MILFCVFLAVSAIQQRTPQAILFFWGNFINTAADTVSYFVFEINFSNTASSGHRKRIRQLRAPPLLDISGFVPLLLLPARPCKPYPMVLVPDSTVHCSRPPARNLHLSSSESTTCKPCPMVFVPDSTVHCSRPPARNLHLSCGTSDGLALGRGRSTVWCGCSS